MTEKSQVPTSSHDSEMATLGSMLWSTKVAQGLAVELVADDFFTPGHQLIFTAICNVVKTRKVDPIVVREELIRTGNIEDAGGAAYLIQLMEFVPSAANGSYYAQIVKDKKFIRDSMNLAKELELVSLSSDIENNSERFAKWDEAMTKVRQSFGRTGQVSSSLSEVFKSMDDGICEAFQGKGPKAFSSGFPSLDTIFRGFFPGRQYFLGGYSKDGKTAMMCELIFRSAKIAYDKELEIETQRAKEENRPFEKANVIGAPWVIFSGEMTKPELLSRFIQSRTGIDANDIVLGKIEGVGYQEVIDVMDEFNRLPIHVVESLGTVKDIYRECLMVKQKYGRIAGFGVDYIQMMTNSFKRDGVREFDALVYSFKEMAKDLNCSSLLLSQLNRDSKKTEGPPQMEQMKGTGGIEASADVVMMLHRPRKGDNGPVEQAQCYIRKNRFGREGYANLQFVPSRVLWKEINETL